MLMLRVEVAVSLAVTRSAATWLGVCGAEVSSRKGAGGREKPQELRA